MRFIGTLKEGDRVNDIYLCKQRNVAVTKNGKEYENVIFQDKSGTIDAKIWDPGSEGIEDCDALDYVHVVGDVTSFNNQLQLNVKRIRKVEEDEYNAADYFPVSERDTEEMKNELRGYIASVKNEYLSELLNKIFTEATIDACSKHSAAKSVHHAFIGGLLEHTLSVTKLCEYYTKQYPILNYDLLISAAMLHDIGKLKEINAFPTNDYTDEGQLLGHIVMGAQIVGRIADSIPDFPKNIKNELMHCILAHHGELEYGSPKKPAIIEAVALNFADNTDAKLETMKELFAATDDKGWLGFNRLLDSNIRKTSEF